MRSKIVPRPAGVATLVVLLRGEPLEDAARA